MITIAPETIKTGTIKTGTTKIGWIGTGVMGLHMCRHIMEQGFNAVVYTRTKSKAQELIDKGASWAETPKQLALDSDVIFTMVGFPEDVRQVYMGTDGILEGAKKSSIIIDMTTTLPSLAEEIYEKAQKKGIYSIDAPVSGGDVGAKNAALSIMAGGDAEIIKTIMPLFEIIGKKIVHQGGPGTGQHTKMCNQIVIAGTMIGMCESLLYGYKAGLDLEVMLSSISGGAAACWGLDNLAPRILKREFDTGFFVEHFVKDMGIALKEADRMNISLPGLALVNQLYKSVIANSGGRLGTQALILSLEKMSNMEF
ncbi:NAD(P)-dependent oxidoreductase [Desulfobacterales bacterium HSG17]|nr:NAD(P)-dependent oxidoreductase [Desulfobacterales bacterium HSG17]